MMNLKQTNGRVRAFLRGMVLACLSLCCSNIVSQNFILKEKSLIDIKKDMNAYYDRIIKSPDGDGVLSAEGSIYNEYKRFLRYWEPRVGSTGDFQMHFNALGNYYANKTALTAKGAAPSTTMSNSWVQWEEIGPFTVPAAGATYDPGYGKRGIGIGPVEFITFYKANPQYMLCGSAEGGLFNSIDGGNNWYPTGSDDWERSGCGSAVFHPQDPTVWFASSSGAGFSCNESTFMGMTGGIYRAGGIGGTWTKIADQSNLNGPWTIIYKLLIDPVNTDVLYAATSSGLFVTYNCMALSPVWTELSIEGSMDMNIFDIEMKPDDGSPNYNETLYVAISEPYISNGSLAGYNNARIAYTTDAALSWSNLPSHPALNSTVCSNVHYSIEVSKNNANRVLSIFFSTCSTPTIQYCDINFANSTAVWTTLPAAGQLGYHGGGEGLALDPFDASQYALSYNTGAMRRQMGVSGASYFTGIHDDVENIAYHPANQNEIWIASDGGLYKSTDNGVTVTNMSNGLGVMNVTGMATAHNSPDNMLIGSYHDLTVAERTPYGGGDPTWTTEGPFGDGMRPLIDPINANNSWVSTQGGANVYSPDYFTSGTTTVSVMGSPTWSNARTLNKINPSTIYGVSGYNVARSTNKGVTSTIVSNFSFLNLDGDASNDLIWEMEAPFSSGDYLYVHFISDHATASEQHHLLRSKIINDPSASNVIANWQEVPIPKNMWISDFDIDYSNPDIVYLAFNSSSQSSNVTTGTQMYFRMDYANPSMANQYSCSGGTCADLTYNLPNIGLGYGDMVELEKGSDGGMYLGTDVGIYYTNNKLLANGTNWINFGTHLPHVDVNGLQINYALNKLRAGTNGRGVWEHDLYCPADMDLTESGTYSTDAFKEAQSHIYSTAIINAPRQITYRAGGEVDLNPGFYAGPGSIFYAYIHACDHPGNSFRPVNSGTTFVTDEDEEEKEELENVIKIFPNPTSGIFSLTFDSDEKFDLCVYDMLGKKVIQKTGQDKKADLDLSSEPAGIYFVKILSENQMITKKVIKE